MLLFVCIVYKGNTYPKESCPPVVNHSDKVECHRCCETAEVSFFCCYLVRFSIFLKEKELTRHRRAEWLCRFADVATGDRY